MTYKGMHRNLKRSFGGKGRAIRLDFGQMCGVLIQRCPTVFLISLAWLSKGTQRLRKCGIKVRVKEIGT